MDAERSNLIRTLIETAKDDIINRSLVSQAAMRAEYMAAVSSENTPSTLSHIMLDKALSRIGNSAAKTEREIAQNVTAQIFEISGDSETPNMQKDLLVFQTDLVKQLSRDARAISSLFRQFQVSLNTMKSNNHPLAKAKALGGVRDPRVFTYKDKAGKIWDANIYLKTHSAQYYYGLTNDLALSGLYSEGRSSATLDRPGHKTDGLEIALSEVSNVQLKYFHPGSQAIMI